MIVARVYLILVALYWTLLLGSRLLPLSAMGDHPEHEFARGSRHSAREDRASARQSLRLRGSRGKPELQDGQHQSGLRVRHRPDREICMLIARPLATRGWAIVTECQSASHPFTSRFARLMARTPSGSVLQLEAEPKDSRGPHLVLSTHGDSEAIPLAREAGSSFFTIRLDSSEDLERGDSRTGGTSPDRTDAAEAQNASGAAAIASSSARV